MSSLEYSAAHSSVNDQLPRIYVCMRDPRNWSSCCASFEGRRTRSVSPCGPLVADWMTPPGALLASCCPVWKRLPPGVSDLARSRVGFFGPLDCGVWNYGLCRQEGHSVCPAPPLRCVPAPSRQPSSATTPKVLPNTPSLRSIDRRMCACARRAGGTPRYRTSGRVYR